VAELTLRQAAGQVGVSRQTVYRMVKDGKLSATLRGDGQKVVDTAELLRVFGRLTHETAATVTRQTPVLQPETPQATAAPGLQAMDAEARRRQYETADRLELRAALAAAKDALQRVEEQLQEAREREVKLLDLAAAQTRLLEHKATVDAPPRGFWRRVFGSK